MNSLFGVELPIFVTFLIAFVIVLALIGAIAWLVRRFGAARLAAGRGRQPRLAVIDAAAVDGRRKLIIIRRDNVEHLLMIGGPTDVVVETNIMRAGPANQREISPARSSIVDPLPRPVPLPDATPWPVQQDPAIALRAERPRVLPEEPAQMPAPLLTQMTTPPPTPSESQVRPPRPTDPLSGLAAELSRAKPEAAPRQPEPLRMPPAPQIPYSETPIAPTAPVAADVHLAEMAHRLETALRRPVPQGSQAAKLEATALRSLAASEPKRADSKPLQYTEAKLTPANSASANSMPGNSMSGKTVYDNLEQEMANLLGRQSGKT